MLSSVFGGSSGKENDDNKPSSSSSPTPPPDQSYHGDDAYVKIDEGGSGHHGSSSSSGSTLLKFDDGEQQKIKVECDDNLVKEIIDCCKKNKNNNKTKICKLIGSIDQGTSSTRFLIFTGTGKILISAQMEHHQYYFPNDHNKIGWHEHDPIEIWHNVLSCIGTAMNTLSERGIEIISCPSNSSTTTTTKSSSSSSSSSSNSDENKQGGVMLYLSALGITNQRETTIAFNRLTGVPYYNAIVWDDLRTSKIADNIANGNKDVLRGKTGLPVASYFAGTKVYWLLENVSAIRRDLSNPELVDNVCFGTIDTWLIYQLTGTSRSSGTSSSSSSSANAAGGRCANKGGLFVTDVTNASRWLFMDIHEKKWDQGLVYAVLKGMNNSCHINVDTALPTILPSGYIYGKCNPEATSRRWPFLDGVPIAGVLGDQQAALFGQTAYRPGDAKNTYGTGLFLMMNTGTKPISSQHGLLTTIAYQIGNGDGSAAAAAGGGGEVHYALEGSVSHSGSTIQWLRDQVKLIKDAAETETHAKTTESNDGLYFVPAFAGLFAPYWRNDARGCIVGITASHHIGHICRSVLESIAYQTRDVFDAIMLDSAVNLKSLRVDGGSTKNDLLMQFQADIINVPVIKPTIQETTALGAAYMAGLTVKVWSNLTELEQLSSIEKIYTPKMTFETRNVNWYGWKKAITKSFNWIDNNNGNNNNNNNSDTDNNNNNKCFFDITKKNNSSKSNNNNSGIMNCTNIKSFICSCLNLIDETISSLGIDTSNIIPNNNNINNKKCTIVAAVAGIAAISFVAGGITLGCLFRRRR